MFKFVVKQKQGQSQSAVIEFVYVTKILTYKSPLTTRPNFKTLILVLSHL